jgi:hypothetical protein
MVNAALRIVVKWYPVAHVGKAVIEIWHGANEVVRARNIRG